MMLTFLGKMPLNQTRETRFPSNFPRNVESVSNTFLTFLIIMIPGNQKIIFLPIAPRVMSYYFK